jgi:hypothetical protein
MEYERWYLNVLFYLDQDGGRVAMAEGTHRKSNIEKYDDEGTDKWSNYSLIHQFSTPRVNLIAIDTKRDKCCDTTPGTRS